jgi:hypothetical protein
MHEKYPFLMYKLDKFLQVLLNGSVQKPNSFLYNFVEVSGRTLESFQTCICNVYIKNWFQTNFAFWGVKFVRRVDCE